MGASDETRVLNILEQTMRLSKDEREGHIRRACGEDVDLYQAVTMRLESSDIPVGDAIPTLLRSEGVDIADLEFSPGDVIGPYVLLRLLGEGGMGRVFMVQQNEPVSRQVALKLIKLGMDTREVLLRFDSERTALAMMSHSNVASALDAGTTQSGRPFFVMEYVDGVPINEYCDTHRLTIRERLQLFVQACDGVQHAHQKGIIHRDLKPNNILVTHRDHKPLAKIIDFGIAKSTDQKLVEDTFLTRFGVVIGTPNYMSPEQAGDNPLDIDTRSDVYAMGVLLYELLTGTQPFEVGEFEGMSLAELQRVIREVDPPTPAERIGDLGESAQAIASLRQMDERALQRRFKGDLSWIVMKAMAKDRTKRYPSAVALAEDIRRYLDFEPVEAGPPSKMYRVVKFMRRHQVLVLSGFAVSVALVGGLLVAGWALLEAQVAHQQAQQQGAVTQATNALLYELFVPESSETAVEIGGRSVDESIDRMLTQLDTGTAFVGPEFVDMAGTGTLTEVELAIRTLVADRDAAMSRPDRAARQYARATRLARDRYGFESREWFVARSRQADGLARTEPDSAVRVYNEVINRGGQLYGADSPMVLAASFGLARLRHAEGNSGIALDLMEQSYRLNAEAENPDPLLEARLMTALSDVASNLGREDAALHFGEGARERNLQLFGPDSLQYGAACWRQAQLLIKSPQPSAAEPQLREALRVHNRHFGYEFNLTVDVHLALADLLVAEGLVAEGESELLALRAGLRDLDEVRADPARSVLSRLVNVHVIQGRLPDALTHAEDLAGVARQSGLDPGESLLRLSRLYLIGGYPENAQESLSQAARTSPALPIGLDAVASWLSGSPDNHRGDLERALAQADASGLTEERDVMAALLAIGDEGEAGLTGLEEALAKLRSDSQASREAEPRLRLGLMLMMVWHALDQSDLEPLAEAYLAEWRALTGATLNGE